jgi:SAM-dependent methyltransferase
MDQIAYLSSSSVLTSSSSSEISFRTSAYGKQEYTNSITASKDTNLSPAEAYDTIRDHVPVKKDGLALDLGAGAGLSTQVLYESGYTIIDAVDWSIAAWETSVIEQPASVRFFELSDQEFFDYIRPTQRRYDAIVYNFAVNPEKAVAIAKTYLNDGGVLLAPCNDRRDYWYKQSYLLLNSNGDTVWKSQPEVGAWSVQFQPDVESKTCTGIWCGAFNGFEDQRSLRKLKVKSLPS